MDDQTIDPRVRRTQRDVVRAAAELFVEGGWAAVTHAEVARRSGYAKATIYVHWPTQLDLVRDALRRIIAAAPHHEPTGDLRADLIGQLLLFNQALTEGHFTRVLGGLLERAGTDPSIDAFRNQIEDSGRSVIDGILRTHLDQADVEPLAVLLSGAVLYRAALQGRAASRPFIEHLVDRVLTTATTTAPKDRTPPRSRRQATAPPPTASRPPAR